MDTESRWADFLSSETDRWERRIQESVRKIAVIIVSISLLVWALLESIRSLNPARQIILDSFYLFGIFGASGLLIMRRVFGAFQVSMGLSGKKQYLQILPDKVMKRVISKGAILDCVALLIFLYAILHSGRIDKFSGLTSLFLGFILFTSVLSVAVRYANALPSANTTYQKIISSTPRRRLILFRSVGHTIFVLFVVIFPAASIYTHWTAYVHIDSLQLSLESLAITTLVYLLLALVIFHPMMFRVGSGMNIMRLQLLLTPNMSEQQLAGMLDKVLNLEPIEEASASGNGMNSHSREH